MATKLVPPDLGRLDEDDLPIETSTSKPDLRSAPRRTEPRVESVLAPGFVAEARLPQPIDPGAQMEGMTIEVPRRLKRALLAEVAARRDDPNRRNVASMKSIILEALSAHGFGELITRSDIEVQAGIFMKKQAARLRRG